MQCNRQRNDLLSYNCNVKSGGEGDYFYHCIFQGNKLHVGSWIFCDRNIFSSSSLIYIYVSFLGPAYMHVYYKYSSAAYLWQNNDISWYCCKLSVNLKNKLCVSNDTPFTLYLCERKLSNKSWHVSFFFFFFFCYSVCFSALQIFLEWWGGGGYWGKWTTLLKLCTDKMFSEFLMLSNKTDSWYLYLSPW